MGTRAPFKGIFVLPVSLCGLFLFGCDQVDFKNRGANTPERTKRSSSLFHQGKIPPPIHLRGRRERALDPWLRGIKKETDPPEPLLRARSNGEVEHEPQVAEFKDDQDPGPSVRVPESAVEARESRNRSREGVTVKDGGPRARAPAAGKPRLRGKRPAVVKAAAPPVQVAAHPPGSLERGRFHRVEEGETLSAIARKNGVTTGDLKRWNPVETKRPLEAGDRLYVPSPQEIQAFNREPEPETPAEEPRIEKVERAPKIPRRSSPDSLAPASAPETGTPPAPAPVGPASAAGFIWPLNGPTISKFGWRDGKPHAGLDIKASTGTEVRAAKAGKVIFSGKMKGFGNTIILDHQDGYFTVYGHNSKNLIAKAPKGRSAWIKQGDLIARVGMTGNATTPHLHFEVRKLNNPMDPLKVLPSLFASQTE